MNEQEKYDWMACVRCYTYNHAPYIEDALNGFTMQETSFPYVCCIVDDASIDGEQVVIKSYLNEHFDLEDKKVAQQKETNDYILTFARHKTNLKCHFAVFYLKYNHYSIKKSKYPYLSQWQDNAKYIAICEGDDYWIEPQKLQMQVAFLEKHEDYGMCFTDVLNLDENKHIFMGKQSDVYFDNNISIEFGGEKAFYDIILRKCRIQTLSVLCKSTLLKQFRKDSSNSPHFLMGDTQLWLFMSQNGKIKYLNECTGVYRIHIGSASRNPENAAIFKFSMYEMRVFECNRYGYKIPNIIKEKYNRSLLTLLFNKRVIKYRPPLFESFKMNRIQTLLFRYSQKNMLLRGCVLLLWKFETLLSIMQIKK